jgi:hypothetical protein
LREGALTDCVPSFVYPLVYQTERSGEI